ncbi:MAG: hypothetical protein KF810_13140 [Rhizobiaceae bacterium]|nr:hypothetical protein [Rhizobiaceae bacterium]
MARKTSTLAMIAAGVGGAAVAGYGLAMGRDAWRSTKRNQSTIVILLAIAGAVALPFLGGRNLVRGHDRGLTATLFLTLIGSTALIAIGLVLAFFLFTAVFHQADEALVGAAFLAVCTTGAITLLGVVWGSFQRPGRRKLFATAKFNDQFLAEQGFTETGGEDITHYDPSGQPLRFLEQHADRLVFMVVGRRGKRTYITLDSDGRMQNYSGV